MMKKLKLCLAIYEKLHQCIVELDILEYIPIDRKPLEPGDNPDSARTPDLAIFIIKDAGLIKAIEQSGNAFLDLDKQNYKFFLRVLALLDSLGGY